MLAGLRQVLISPATGMISMAAALALGIALAMSAAGWQAQRASYEARIAELTRTTARAEAELRTELAACHAAGEARDRMEAEFAARGPTPEGARRLLEQSPEGIDACARMESADRAVLSNLKK